MFKILEHLQYACYFCRNLNPRNTNETDQEVLEMKKRSGENSHQLLDTKTEFKGQGHQNTGAEVGGHHLQRSGAKVVGHCLQSIEINTEKRKDTRTVIDINIKTLIDIGREEIDDSVSYWNKIVMATKPVFRVSDKVRLKSPQLQKLDRKLKFHL